MQNEDWILSSITPNETTFENGSLCISVDGKNNSNISIYIWASKYSFNDPCGGFRHLLAEMEPKNIYFHECIITCN